MQDHAFRLRDELLVVGGRQVTIERGAINIQLVQEDEPFALRIDANIELPAARLFFARAACVLVHQRKKTSPVLLINRELDGNHIHRGSFQLTKMASISATCEAVSAETLRPARSSVSLAVCSSSSALSTAASIDVPVTTGPWFASSSARWRDASRRTASANAL